MQPLMLTAKAESFDLGSTSATISAPSSGGIRVGGGTRAVNAGDMITPAEFAALNQVVASGRQTINLNALGAATSGRIHIGADIASNLTNLVIPQGVTGLGDFSKMTGLNVVGNLVNSGNLYAYSTSVATSVASINAGNIVNNQGALLTTVLPSGSLGLSNTVSNLSLSLNAVNDIMNAGVISSAGALTLNASGKVVNAGAAGAPTAVMQAAHDVNISTDNITNGGLVSSLNKNINLVSKTQQALNINARGGKFEAKVANINIGSLASTGTKINIDGGDYHLQQLNINAPGGNIEGHLGEVTGTMNSSADVAHIGTSTPTLKLGNIKMDGDPTFYNQGNIQITGDVVVGEALAILAEGNITTVAGVNEISARGTGAPNPNGQGFDINIIAGADLTPSGGAGPGSPAVPGDPPIAGGEFVDLDPNNLTGGNIDFSASPALQINANSTAACPNCNGANVTIAAFGGAGGNGNITLPAGSSINTSGDGNGNNGNISVIGNGDISVGNMTANGSAGGGGIVNVSTAQPVTTGGGGIATFDSTGTIVGGQQFIAGAPTNESITAAGTINARSTTLSAGDALTVGAVNTGDLTMLGNSIALSGSLSTSVGLLAVSRTNITSTAPININGNSIATPVHITMIAGANYTDIGGAVIVDGTTSSGNIDLRTSAITSLITNGAGGAAGNVTLVAYDGTAAGNGLVMLPDAVDLQAVGLNNASDQGNVFIVAGNNGGATSIQLGSISTSGGSTASAVNSTGSVFLNAGTPTSGVSLSTGVGAGQYTFGQFNQGAPAVDGDISVFGTIATVGNGLNGNGNGGFVRIDGGAAVSVGGAITTSASLAGGDGGAVVVSSVSPDAAVTLAGAVTTDASGTGNAGAVSIQAATSALVTVGPISAQANGSGFSGGIDMRNNGSGVANGGVLVTGTLSVANANGNGGSISINAFGTFSDGTIQINSSLSSEGAPGFDNGSITLSGDSLVLTVPIDLRANDLLHLSNQGTGNVSIILNSGITSASAITIDAGNDINLQFPGFAVVATAVSLLAGGDVNAFNVDIDISNGGIPSGDVILDSGRFADNTGVQVGDISTAGSFFQHGDKVQICHRNSLALAVGVNTGIISTVNGGTPFAGDVFIHNFGDGVANGGITVTGSPLIVSAPGHDGGHVTIDAGLGQPAAGAVTFFGGTTIDTGGVAGTSGSISIAGSSIDGSAGLNLNTNGAVVATETVTFDLLGGAGTLNGSITTRELHVNSTGTLTQAGGDIQTDRLVMNATGNTSFASATNNVANLEALASIGGNFTLNNGNNNIDIDGIFGLANVTIINADTVTNSTNSSVLNLTINAVTITVSNGGYGIAQEMRLTASNMVDVTAFGGLSSGNIFIETPLLVNDGQISASGNPVNDFGYLAVNNSLGNLTISNASTGLFEANAGASFSATGNVDIGGIFNATPFVTAGGKDFLAVAGGNIFASGAGSFTIDTSSNTGDGGDISLIAGANYALTPGVPGALDVTGPSATGGSLSLNFTKIIFVKSSSTTGAGGRVVAVALPGAVPGSGTITFDSTATINTTGVTGGDLFMAAGLAAGTAISVGDIDAGTGTITLAAGVPEVLPPGPVTYTNAQQTSGGYGVTVPTGAAINQSGGEFTGTRVILFGGGDMTNGGAGLQTEVSELQVNGTGNAFVVNSITGPLQIFNSSANDFRVNNNADPVIVLQPVNLTGQFDVFTSDFSVTGTASLTAAGINGSGPAGQAVVLNNSGSVTATTFSITWASPPGQDLVVGGGGTMSAPGGTIVLTATDNGIGGANQLIFSGDQTFNTITELRAQGVNQAVWVQAPATVVGLQQVTVFSPRLILDGILIGNPLIFDSPFGGGTIANSVGNVTLASNLVFNGLSMAIISVGSIIGTGITSIDLSGPGPTADGGSLTMVTGFQISPPTPGQVQDSTAYTIGTPTGAGSINLSGVSINTSASGAGAVAGDVIAVANGGSVTLGPIDASADPATGVGGDVLVIGQNGITVDAIDNTAATDGTVQLHAAMPQTTGSTVIGDGILLSGGFQPITGTYNSNILIRGLVSTGGIVIVTDGNASIRQTPAGHLTAASVDLQAGSGGIGTSALNLQLTSESVFAVSSGNVYLTDDAALVQIGDSSGATFNVTATAPNADLRVNGTVGFNFGAFRTTSGGDIAINGSIGADGTFSALTLFLDANADGKITRGALGQIDGNSLTMTSGTGTIGTSINPMLVNVAQLSVNTGNTTGGEGAFIVNSHTGAFELLTSSSGTGSEFVYVGDESTLNINGPLGSLTRQPNISVTTDGNLNFNAVTRGQLTGVAVGTANISAAIFGGTGDIDITSGGNMNVSAPVRGENVDLKTLLGSSASITLQANVIADSTIGSGLSISADGAGNITQTGGTLSTGGSALSLASGSGNIGNALASIAFNAASIDTDTDGDTYLSSLGLNTLVTARSSRYVMTSNFDVEIGGIRANRISVSTTSGGDIEISGLVSLDGGAGKATDVFFGSAGLIVNTSVLPTAILADNLTMTSIAGDIGSSLTPITTNATSLTLNSQGSIYVVDSSNSFVTLNASSAGSGVGQQLSVEVLTSLGLTGALSAATVRLTSGNSISVPQTITADNIFITTTNNGNIAVAGNLTATSSITLNANGSGNVTQNAGMLLSAPSLSMTSGTGTIGTLSHNIITDATTLSANTSGNVYIDDVNTGTVTLLPSSGLTFDLQVTDNINLSSLAADIGTIVSTGAGGIITLTGAVTGLVVADAVRFTFETAADGQIRDTFQNAAAPTIAADRLVLVSGSVGTGSNRIIVSAGDLTADGVDDVYVTDRRAGLVVVDGSAGANFQVSTAGTMQIGINGITGTSDIVLSSGGDIVSSGVDVQGNDLTLTYSPLGFANFFLDVDTLTVLSGADLNVSNNGGLTVGTLNVTNSVAIQSGFLSSGNLVVNGAIIVADSAFLRARSGDLVLNNSIDGDFVDVIASGTIIQTAGLIGGNADLYVEFGTGPVALNTDVAVLTTAAPGQDLTISELSGISLMSQDLRDLNVTASQLFAGTVDISAPVSVRNLVVNNSGAAAVNVLQPVTASGSITISGAFSSIAGPGTLTATGDVDLAVNGGIALTGKITGDTLRLTFGGSPVLTTNVNTLHTIFGSTLTINEDNGINIFTQNLSGLTVNAGLVGTGDIVIQAPLTFINDLRFDNDNGGLVIGENVTANDITFDVSGGITQLASTSISTDQLDVFFGSGLGRTDLTGIVNRLNTTATGLDFYWSQSGGVPIILDTQAVNSLLVTSTGDVTIFNNLTMSSLEIITNGGDIFVNANVNANVNLFSDDLIQGAGLLTGTTAFLNAPAINLTGKVSMQDLNVMFSNANTVTLNTNVDSLTTVAGGILNIIEDNGISLLTQGVSELDVLSSFAGSGDIEINATLNFNRFELRNPGGNIVANFDVTSTTSITLDTGAGAGSITGVGRYTGDSSICTAAVIDSSFSGSSLSITTNGSADIDTDVSSISTAGTGSVQVNEDDGIIITAANNFGAFRVRAGALGLGPVATFGVISNPSTVSIINEDGDILINNNINIFNPSGPGSLVLDTQGTGDLTSVGSITVTGIGGALATFNADEIIIADKVSVQDLNVTFSSTSTVSLSTNVFNLMTGNGEILNITEDDSITIQSQGVETLRVIAGGGITITNNPVLTTLDLAALSGAIDVSSDLTADTVIFNAPNGAIGGAGKVNVQDLSVTFNNALTSTINTKADTLTSGGGDLLVINEDNGIELLGQNVTTLDVRAGLTGPGDITAATAFTVPNLLLDTNDGNIVIDAVLTGTNANLNSSGNISMGLGGGKVAYQDLHCNFSTAGGGIAVINTSAVNLFADGGNRAFINEDDGITIQSALVTDLDVDAGRLSPGDITLATPVILNELELKTDGNINLSTFGLACTEVELQATGGITGTGLITTDTLILSFSSANTVSLDTNIGSLITLNGGTLNINEFFDVTVLGQGVDNLVVDAQTITIGAPVSLDGTGSFDPNGGALLVDFSLTANDLSIIGSSGANLLLGATVTGTNSILLSTDGSITQTGGKLVGGTLTVGGSFTGGTTTLNTNVVSLTTTGGIGQTLIINEDNDLSLLGQAVTNLSATAGVASFANLTLDAVISLTGNLTLSAPGSITTSAANVAGANVLSIQNGSAPAMLRTNVNTLTVNSGGDVTITETDSISLDGIDSNNFTLTAGSNAIANTTVQMVNNVTPSFALSLSVVSSTASFVSNTDFVSGTSITIDAPNGSLTLSGDGTYVSNQTTITSSGVMTFANNDTFEFLGPVSMQSPVSIALGGAGTAVAGDSLVSVQTPLFSFNNGTITGNPLVFSGVAGSGGTIANSLGDLVLTGNYVFPGQNLTLLAAGNVIASSSTAKIDLSSKTANGGSLTVMAGYDFTGTDSTTPNTGVYTILNESAEGGSIFMAKTAITTGTSFTGNVTPPGGAASGGSVTMVANAGTLNAGSIFTGAITTSATNAAGTGGAITLIGEGGVQTGNLITKSPTGAPVLVDGAAPVLVNTVTFSNGTLTSGSLRGSGTTPLAGAAILVNGSITTTGTVGRAGDVSLFADSQIEITGGIIATGTSSSNPLLPSAGGNVAISSDSSKVTTGSAGINTSGINVNRATRAGSAGDIIIFASNLISTGSLIAKGGDNAGAGGGGHGGEIDLQTLSVSLPGPTALGTAKVTGFMDARGGASKLAGGTGGNGGEIFTDTTTLQVTGMVSGSSIIASGGLGAVPASNGGNGDIEINTYAVQPMPTLLDLTISARSIAVLPGGMFQIGSSAVNGTAGPITSGATAATKTFNGNGQIFDGSGFNQGTISIEATGGARAIDQGGAPVVTPLTDALGKRSLIAPSQALALFQVSRGQPQALAVSSAGVATGGSITLDQTDVNGITLTGFKLPTFVTMNITGDRPALTMPASIVWNGTLNFPDANSIGYINFGGASPVINGTLTSAADGTIILSGTGGTITNNGNILVNVLVLNRPGTSALTFTGGALSDTEAVGGAVTGELWLPSLSVGRSVNFKALGADSFDLPVNFVDFNMPTLYRADATAAAANVNVNRTVSLSFSLAENVGGNIVSQDAIVGGSFGAAGAGPRVLQATIKGVEATASGTKVQTRLIVADSSNFRTLKNMVLSSTNQLVIDNDATLTAGELKAIPGTLVAPSDIGSAGSLQLLSTGTGGILIKDDVTLTANGGNVTATASNATGNIQLQDNATVTAMGGNIVMLAKGTVSGDDNNDFLAVGTTTGANGGIEIASGTTTGKLSAAFSKPAGTGTALAPTMNAVVAGTNGGVIMLNAVGAGASVNLGGATLDLQNKGGMVFGSSTASGVTFDSGNTFTTRSSKPIAFTSTVVPDADMLVFDADKQVDRTDSGSCRIIGTEGSKVAVKGDYLKMYDGEIFVEAADAMEIRTVHGDIELKKGALVHVDVRNSNVYVKACGNPGDVTVYAYNHKMPLPPGQEIILSAQSVYDKDMLPADGVGRRNQERMKLDGGHAVMSDVSLVTVISNVPVLRNATDAANKRVINRMLKTAAALDMITKARGGYSATPREAQKRLKNQSLDAPGYAASGNHLSPVSYTGGQ